MREVTEDEFIRLFCAEESLRDVPRLRRQMLGMMRQLGAEGWFLAESASPDPRVLMIFAYGQGCKFPVPPGQPFEHTDQSRGLRVYTSVAQLRAENFTLHLGGADA